MHMPDAREVVDKKQRLMQYMAANGYNAVVMGRLENFAWFTSGASRRLIQPSEFGAALLVVTKENVFLIAQTMDGPRILEEEIGGFGFEPVFLKWFEQSREQKAEQMIKGLRTLSDIPLKGADCLPSEFSHKLHFPLTDQEIEKSRWVAGKTDEIMRTVADSIKPGTSEREIEAAFLYQCGQEGMSLDVILIGSDERIDKFRHPCPTEKKVEKSVLLHIAPKKWGLHAAVSRMVYFGDQLPQETASKYDAACRIQAAATSMCIPG